MATGKKGSGGFSIVFILIIIGIFIGVPAILEKIKTVFSPISSSTLETEDYSLSPTLGTEDYPFDWSSPEKQVASAPSLPEEGSVIYVKIASGQTRLARKGEISWTKNEYKNSKSATVSVSATPVNTVKPGNTSTAVSATPATSTPIATAPAASAAQRSASMSNQRQESSSQRYTPYIPDPPVIMYYGANIGQFPPEVRNWIENNAFPKSKMERPAQLNPQLRAWWSDDGNTVMFEASYTVANGYVGAGTRKTWGSGTWYGGTNLQRYGQYAKYKTLKFQYDLKRETEYLIANDPAYAEVINFARRLCREIEYDWAAFSAYHGPRPIRTPGMRYAVCAGYSDEVMNKVLSLNCVKSVEEWTSPGHAWNVINLIDGRALYFDLTWFDNEHIDEKTGKVYQTDDYDWGKYNIQRGPF